MRRIAQNCAELRGVRSARVEHLLESREVEGVAVEALAHRCDQAVVVARAHRRADRARAGEQLRRRDHAVAIPIPLSEEVGGTRHVFIETFAEAREELAEQHVRRARRPVVDRDVAADDVGRASARRRRAAAARRRAHLLVGECALEAFLVRTRRAHAPPRLLDALLEVVDVLGAAARRHRRGAGRAAERRRGRRAARRRAEDVVVARRAEAAGEQLGRRLPARRQRDEGGDLVEPAAELRREHVRARAPQVGALARAAHLLARRAEVARELAVEVEHRRVLLARRAQPAADGGERRLRPVRHLPHRLHQPARRRVLRAVRQHVRRREEVADLLDGERRRRLVDEAGAGLEGAARSDGAVGGGGVVEDHGCAFSAVFACAIQ